MNYWTLIDGDNTLLTNFDLTEDSLVIDFGGYEGNWSENIIKKYNPYVGIYEPISDFYLSISKKFHANTKVMVVRKAIWINNDILEFGVEKSSTGFFNKSDIKESVPCVDVISELEHYPKIDLAKFNIEGCEYRVLNRIVDYFPNKISNILVQFHELPKDIPPIYHERMSNVQRRLSETHELVWSFPYIWELWKLKS